MKKEPIKITLFIKYLLLFILIILTFYLFVTSYKLKIRRQKFKSDIEVSKLSGKHISTINSSDIIYNIKYDGTNIFDLYKVYDNEILYEIFDKKNDILTYRASSLNNIGSHNSITYLNSEHINTFPVFDFTENEYTDTTSPKNNSDIFIEYSENNSTSFIYSAGNYKYINSISQESKHIESGFSLTFANVFIQFIDSNSNTSGTGLLFSNGESFDISWNNNIFLFKNTNSLMTLNTGNTIWIPLDINDKDKIVFNK
ncbi:MAG: DUF3048 C-terminal domain-containing protein [Sarcina sp.]